MFGYPLFLNLQGRPCVVFGGGKVAYRKVQALLERGARVTCVSKEFCGPLKRLARFLSLRVPLRRRAAETKQSRDVIARTRSARSNLQSLRLLRRRYAPPRNDGLLNGARLVIAATSDRAFNERLARQCRKKKIFINVVDDPELCDFYAPAVVKKGPLQIAISTGGTSPGFAKRLRQELERAIPSSVGRALETLGKIRRMRGERLQ